MWWFLNEKDKLQHVLAGIVGSQVLVILIQLFCNISIYCPIILSLIISSAVAYGKELLYDKILNKGYSIKNFIASEIGIVYGLLTSLIIFLI